MPRQRPPAQETPALNKGLKNITFAITTLNSHHTDNRSSKDTPLISQNSAWVSSSELAGGARLSVQKMWQPARINRHNEYIELAHDALPEAGSSLWSNSPRYKKPWRAIAHRCLTLFTKSNWMIDGLHFFVVYREPSRWRYRNNDTSRTTSRRILGIEGLYR